MFFGLFSKKKSDKKDKAVIPPPPKVTNVEFNSPLGDRYYTYREGDKQISGNNLSGLTSRAIQTGQSALADLADELYTPSEARLADISRKAQDYYDIQAGNINSEADTIFSKAASNLSKRFGGTYNATFGADYLSRLENNRLAQLADASKQANLLAEDLYTQDENSRLQRFQLFSNFLNNEFSKASGLAADASSLLANEAAQAQSYSLAASRLNALNSAGTDNSTQRMQALNSLLGAFSSVLAF